MNWKGDFAASAQPVVVYCAHGRDIGQGLTSTAGAAPATRWFSSAEKR